MYIYMYNGQERFVCMHHLKTQPSNLIIGGDMNAQIGKDENNKFGLHNMSKRKGAYLTELSLENRQKCLNTKFRQGKVKLCIHPDENKSKN